jgi:hypothetical protein
MRTHDKEEPVHKPHKPSIAESHPELFVVFFVKKDGKSGIAGAYETEEAARASFAEHHGYHSGEAKLFLSKANAERLSGEE